MNCLEAQRQWQRRLDGGAPEDGPALARHLEGCPRCRELHDAVPLLESAFPSLTPTPPAGLADRLVAREMARQQARRRRRLLMACAAAAALLVAAFLGYSRIATGPSPRPGVQPAVAQNGGEEHPAPAPGPALPGRQAVARDDRPSPPAPPAPSLQESVQDAGAALAGLTRRTADETVGPGRLLLPDPSAVAAPVEGNGWEPDLEPPARSLAEAGQGVSTGLEPVTSAGRRAVDLFLRDLPPVGGGPAGGW